VTPLAPACVDLRRPEAYVPGLTSPHLGTAPVRGILPRLRNPQDCELRVLQPAGLRGHNQAESFGLSAAQRMLYPRS